MTHIVVPFTKLAPGVVDALEATGRSFDLAEMTDDESYWRLLRDLWAEGDDFAIVEHDVRVHSTVFDELEACPFYWCAYPNEYINGINYGMSCVRFRGELLWQAPWVMELVGAISDELHPPRHWCRLDMWLQRVALPQAHVQLHRHPIVVGHSHIAPTHGCIT